MSPEKPDPPGHFPPAAQRHLGRVALLALGEPDVIALWFGESDLVTPDFIRDAAKKALDEGRTFYTNARGTLRLAQGDCRISTGAHWAPMSHWSASPFRAPRCWRL